MRFRSILGLGLLLVVGCSKDSGDTAKTNSTATAAPVTGGGTTDTPASGQAQGTPPPSTPPATAASTPPTAPKTTPSTTVPVTTKPGLAAAPIQGAPAANNAISATNGLYTFKYAPKVGELNYNMTTSMDMGNGKPMDMSSTISNKISKNADGTYTVVSTLNAPGGFGGAAGHQTSTSVVDSKGRIVSTKGKGIGTNADPFGATSFSNALPDHPVKIGDTWSASGSGKSGGMVCKLVKVDSKGGSQIATVEIAKMSIPTGGMMTMKLTKPAQFMVEVGTGVMRSINIDAEMGLPSQPSGGSAPPAGFPKSLKVHMKMEKQ